MATNKKNAPNIDLSDNENYPDGRIQDNTGSGNGTPVNRLLYSDIHEFFAKLMRLGNIPYNGLPDNEANTHQLVTAAIALAGKNDFIYSLSDIGGVINIATDLSIIKDGEMLMARAGFNFASQTNIKGTTATLYGTIIPSSFKNNDYILLIKSGSSAFIIQRLADANNIDTLVSEFNFLKGANSAEEFAGTATNKATTPYTNQLAFARRVIGLDSGLFLASSVRNGLMSKEDKAILDGLSDPVKNRGWFSGLDPGSASQIGSQLPRSGDIVSATVLSQVDTIVSNVRVVFANPMASANYYCRFFLESEGSLQADNNMLSPIFKKETNTQFLFSLEERVATTASIKVHIEVVQI
ncbi:hypothetical protein [Pedobacter ureilyticus]|uniref:Baseplate protein J-like domain-containing protein n=1 Tax=Pedobacter ureilyticus TaxID=1393051 RepID=A0ABW9J3Q9_9SPHI|nr:hypothetical protein [Pedobacter helvus]